ncbi:MAG: hypothetical protein JKY48_03725, partial [Flavobacteriales bacterium]|nr:hypothetical protein [Flavobacteriales bacterium]
MKISLLKTSLLLFSLSLLLLGCSLLDTKKIKDKIPGVTPPDVVTSPLATEEQKQFFYAWLADCANDSITQASSPSVAKANFLHVANQRIKLASRNPEIQSFYGTDTLVWGPALSVGLVQRGLYSTSNLIYCVRSKKPVGGVYQYSIGISGTNMISP